MAYLFVLTRKSYNYIRKSQGWDVYTKKMAPETGAILTLLPDEYYFSNVKR